MPNAFRRRWRANALLEAEISARKRTEAFLVHAAYHDDLTGLRSRSYFIDALAEAIGRAAGSRERFAVLFIDLDRFKLVNDSLGHAHGDALLVGIAERVRTSLRPGDTLARLGGDEFAVLLEDVADETQAIAVAQRIESALRAPFELGETEVFSSASIGIALGTDDVESPEHILHDADCAMYEAKRASGGRGGHAVYEEAMHANAKAALRLQTDLQHALERREFRLHYQPIVRLDTERVVGFEALVRWQHPGRGLIYPGEFIAAAEETGLIVGIGAWVLREACMQMHEWDIAYGDAGLCVMSVNVSSRQLTQQSFYEDVLAVIGETGVDPRCIELEITESVLLVNADLVGRTLVKLRALGFRIALDDFGTGYSSLSYLQRYNVDTLKIDQSFVRGMDGISCNKDLIKTFVALSDALGLNVVAEGVETAEQCETVRALGCSFAQGYYFAKPQPDAEITRLIAALDAIACSRPDSLRGDRYRARVGVGEAAPAAAFRDVERDVGGIEQFARVASVVGIHRDAHARTRLVRRIPEVDRLRERFDDALGEQRRGIAVDRPFLNDRKFVAARRTTVSVGRVQCNKRLAVIRRTMSPAP